MTRVAFDLEPSTFWASTVDGWELEMQRFGREVRRSHPILIVPGYAMNCTVLTHHPRGISLVTALVEGGYEVWSVNLRGAGASRSRVQPPGPIALSRYIRHDFPAALNVVREHCTTPQSDVFCVGTSLGGSVIFAHLAQAGPCGVAGVVAVGAPLRWDAVHPFVRTLFRSRRLARRLPMRGVGRVARALMPPLARAGLLGIYVNKRHLDLDRVHEVVSSVEDPAPPLNAEMAEWLKTRDLILLGRNTTRALADIELPLFVVLASHDGVVPPSAARSAATAWGGEDIEVVEVGTRDDWYSHADLFVANDAPEQVFTPILRWLDAHDGAA